MRWSGLPLTLLIVTVSVAISLLLFQLGVYLFFLPIIFIPFARFFKRPTKTSHDCPACGFHSDGNYCSRCGAKIS